MTIPAISTVKQFSAKYPAFPEGGMRHKIFHADTNGLEASGALVRDGRKILIMEDQFFEWLTKRGK